MSKNDRPERFSDAEWKEIQDSIAAHRIAKICAAIAALIGALCLISGSLGRALIALGLAALCWQARESPLPEKTQTKLQDYLKTYEKD